MHLYSLLATALSVNRIMYLLVKNRDGRIVDATKQAERANVVSGEVYVADIFPCCIKKSKI